MQRRTVLTSGLAFPLVASTGLAIPRSLLAQDLSYEDQPVTRWRIGLVLTTPVTCTNVMATFPVPTEWPEQTVTIRSQNIPANVRIDTRDLSGAKQVIVQIPRVAAGSRTEVNFEFDIQRSRVLPPETTDTLVKPQRIARELRRYMGNSPFIDASHRKIRNACREIETQTFSNHWEQVEAIYDYVREKVQYVEGDLKNASKALEEGKGDCEEMTSLFVAMCRNLDIPARVVWIPDHCYPEFYLEDANGDGHWYPCQAAGTRQFGRMDETRPVLQKGDRFKVPEKKGAVRYVSEFFRCDRRGKGNPKPIFIRERIDV
ncbi:MAG: transglutaminase-like domain-containing protein [Planctomycetota bacterium]